MPQQIALKAGSGRVEGVRGKRREGYAKFWAALHSSSMNTASCLSPARSMEYRRHAVTLSQMKSSALNIARTGRILRACFGVACVFAGLVLSGYSLWLCLTLVGAGGLGLFEAARGWCLARACGIKAKI